MYPNRGTRIADWIRECRAEAVRTPPKKGSAMMSNASIFDYDFDARTIKDLERLRVVRLDIAQEQLGQIHQTAKELNHRGIHHNCGDAAFVAELRIELEAKVKMLEARLSKKGVFYTDEVQMYLSLADNTLPA